MTNRFTEKLNGVMWNRNDIQFVRLIVTMKKLGVLNVRVAHKLAKEWGMNAPDVVKLIDRADEIWAEISKLNPMEAELKPNHLATTDYLEHISEYLLSLLKARRPDTPDTPVAMLGKETVRVALYDIHGYSSGD